MIKKTIICVLVALTSLSTFSQTRDVNITLSPYAEYSWSNKNTTLDNSMFWGARAGFSFGPLFEIRGFYQRANDVKASIRPIDWNTTNNWADMMTRSNVDIERYGGEMKLNIMNNGFFAPYVTLGGGIQNMKYKVASTDFPMIMNDKLDEKIFGAIGIGTKFNLSDRVVLSLEAKNTFYNVNDKYLLLNSEYNVSEDGSKRLGNWSAMASLDFYLGGTKSYNNEVHKAYEKMFSDGFAGVKFVIEPSLAYVNLGDDTLFDEQYFLGASAGFDFSSLVGIRGFYYQATETPNKFSLDFNNKLSMYGANIIARLNQPRGVNPYLILGGGYINTGNNYVNNLGEQGNQSRGFAMGGVGIEIPLSKYIALYGNINAMLSSEGNNDLAEIESTSQVKTSMMYQTGIRFNLGKSANEAYVVNQTTTTKIESDKNNQQINELRITADELSRIVREAVRETREEYTTPIQPAPEPVEVKQQTYDDGTSATTTKETHTKSTQEQSTINNKDENNTIAVASAGNEDIQRGIAASNDMNARVETQLKSLNNTIQAQSAIIAELQSQSAQYQSDSQKSLKKINKSGKKLNSKNPFMRFSGIAPIGAIDFGTQFNWNVGARGYWQIKNSNFDLMPELYLAFGDKTKFGASANLLYTFNSEEFPFNPYIGFGFGAFPGKKTIWGTNVIVGTNYNTPIGTLFIDYSVRSSFKQNQIALGYKLSF